MPLKKNGATAQHYSISGVSHPLINLTMCRYTPTRFNRQSNKSIFIKRVFCLYLETLCETAFNRLEVYFIMGTD